MTETMSTITKVKNREEVVDRLLDLEDALKERGVQSLMLFGSAIRDEMRPDSDVDIAIVKAPDAHCSLLDIKGLLTDALGREVHIGQKHLLKPGAFKSATAEGVEIF